MSKNSGGRISMANRYLLPLYKKLYDKEFNYSDFNQRMEMQKAVYLLQNMGVPVGDYGFRWYLHGPYSQVLLDDMHFEGSRGCLDPNLSEEYNDKIERLYSVIHSSKNTAYTITNWVECLASLHYLRENVVSFNSSIEMVVSELEKRKTHLNQHTVNITACRLVEELFA